MPHGPCEIPPKIARKIYHPELDSSIDDKEELGCVFLVFTGAVFFSAVFYCVSGFLRWLHG